MYICTCRLNFCLSLGPVCSSLKVCGWGGAHLSWPAAGNSRFFCLRAQNYLIKSMGQWKKMMNIQWELNWWLLTHKSDVLSTEEQLLWRLVASYQGVWDVETLVVLPFSFKQENIYYVVTSPLPKSHVMLLKKRTSPIAAHIVFSSIVLVIVQSPFHSICHGLLCTLCALLVCTKSDDLSIILVIYWVIQVSRLLDI